jgi:hypothetical protein
MTQSIGQIRQTDHAFRRGQRPPQFVRLNQRTTPWIAGIGPLSIIRTVA